jgi:hypothetical protein
MKKIITICAAVLMTASVFAQAPNKMSYQAVVRDASNNLVASTAVGMQISILQGSATGAPVYVETQTPTTNINGLVSLEIGSGTVVSGTFATIDWANGPYFIKTETDPTGGTSYTITGTSQLLSVPYALHATTADSIVGGVSAKLNAGTNITIVGNTISAAGSSNNFYLGQDTLGGIVYYIYKDATGAQHGLIVNKTESTAAWQATSIATGANRTEDGAYNTGLMTNSAAATYVTGLGAGWYLPSVDELGLLYHNRFLVNKALRAGSWALLSSTATYWSSSEYNTLRAFRIHFDSGNANVSVKYDAHIIRAVRAF